MKRKILSMLCAICLVVSMIPTAAFAAEFAAPTLSLSTAYDADAKQVTATVKLGAHSEMGAMGFRLSYDTDMVVVSGTPTTSYIVGATASAATVGFVGFSWADASGVGITSNSEQTVLTVVFDIVDGKTGDCAFELNTMNFTDVNGDYELNTPAAGSTTSSTVNIPNVVNKYSVTWKSQDGETALETDADVASGAAPSYDGAEPTKAADAQYTYTFAGWATEPNAEAGTAEADLPAVSGAATYYAAFSKTVNKYSVTWKSQDGETTLETDADAEYGAKPSFDGAEPTKAADAQYTYTFAGWATEPNAEAGTAEADLPAVSGAATYYAAFSKTVNKYSVAVSANNNEYGTVSGANEYEYGTDATVIAVANDGYHFVNWTEDGAEVSTNAVYTFEVTADHSLVAVFEEDEVAVTEAPVITYNEDTFTVTVTGNGTVKVYVDGVEVTSPYTFEKGDEAVTYTVTATAQEDGKEISETATRTVVVPAAKYAVTVTNGTADKATAAKDETVTITAAAPADGMKFKAWTTEDGVIFADASAAETTFTMPAKAVTVTATYEPIPAPEYVAKIGDQGYETLDAAIAAAQDDDIIVLLKDVTVASVDAEGNTIDLAGHTLTADVYNATLVMNGGTLVTSQGYKMAGPDADYYQTNDAVFTMASPTGDITLHDGTMTLVQDEWWTLATQVLKVESGAIFKIPAGKTLNVLSKVIAAEGTLVVDGTANLYTASATIETADDDLNVITTVANSVVAYEGGVYKVTDIPPAPTTAYVELYKTDASGNPLKGATFTLTPATGGDALVAVSNEKGTVPFENVSNGTYVLAETEAPTGYVKSAKTYTIVVNTNAETDDMIVTWYGPDDNLEAPIRYEGVTVINEAENTEPDPVLATIVVKKIDGEGNPLAGAKFVLENRENEYEATSDANGLVTFTNVEPGYYTLTETVVPDGYTATEWTYNFNVNDSGAVFFFDGTPGSNGFPYSNENPVEIVNEKIPEIEPETATIVIKKTDAEGKALAGATFQLKEVEAPEWWIDDNEPVPSALNDNTASAISGSDGLITFTDVADGWYELTEQSAPAGYVKSEETWLFFVDGGEVSLVENNDPVFYDNDLIIENEKTQSNPNPNPNPNPTPDPEPVDPPALNKEDHNAFLQGYADGTFRPEKNMTRAQVTVMFARLLVEQMEVGATYECSFSDVPADYWAANAIGYMEKFGIITGFSDGTFRPDAPVTRAQFAAIACRFEELTEGTKTFTDVPADHWAAKYISFAAERGWVTGYADGSFRPNEYITRAQVAAVTCRLLERTADQDYIKAHFDELTYTFTDMDESHFAYWYALEASNGHDYTKEDGVETWVGLK